VKVYIEDLDSKITLVLRSGISDVRTNGELLLKMNISKDYLSRIKSGTRVLSEDRFLELCDILNVDQKIWYLPLFEFGQYLNFSRKQISLITRTPLPGIDFSSRIKDHQMIDDIYELINGYWESYYYSVSNMRNIVVRKDIICVDRVNEDGFIECRVLEEDIYYKGVCFPIKSHLMFILEKELIYNEIIVYCTNLPERNPPMLYGVLLCLSGGVHEMYTYPASSKVAFKYIGSKNFVKERYGSDDFSFIEKTLKDEFCGYVDPDTVTDDEVVFIINNIKNIITEYDIPSAITMRGFRK